MALGSLVPPVTSRLVTPDVATTQDGRSVLAAWVRYTRRVIPAGTAFLAIKILPAHLSKTPRPNRAVLIYFTSRGEISPDGRWLAYSSNESGLPEVYVVPFRTAADGIPSISGGRWQLSNGGGVQPVWRGDGKELFFTNSSYNTLMSVHLNMTVDHFENDKPQLLFDLDAHAPTRFYVVSRDGQRIYMATYGAGSTAPITVTTNWMNLLKK